MMKTIAIHSHKGGTGKTTLALLLAKHVALGGEKVCVVDYDFIGAGLRCLVSQDGLPRRCVGELLTDTSADPLKVADFLGEHEGFSVIPGMYDDEETRRDVLDRVADEPHYGCIKTKTKTLLGELRRKGFGLVIFDCHAGLAYLSEAMTTLADLNLYVAIPDPTCPALHAALEAKGFDPESAVVVYNRMPAKAYELAGQADMTVPECEELGNWGRTADPAKFEFCPAILRRLGELRPAPPSKPPK